MIKNYQGKIYSRSFSRRSFFIASMQYETCTTPVGLFGPIYGEWYTSNVTQNEAFKCPG